MPENYPDQLAKAKDGNFGHLLFRCARLFNEAALARIQAEGGRARLRASHTSLLPHIDLEGTRMVDLARRVGISKQAVGQLVQDLEELGVLQRQRDPVDRRAWRVTFTSAGRDAMMHGLSVLKDLEADMRLAVGDARADRLVEDLASVQTWLESRH